MHGSIWIGEVEVVALCDAVVRASETIAESFPTVPADEWPRLLSESPGTADEQGRWLLHVHCFLVRTEGRTILFDTGIGPPSAPAFAWTGTGGSLPTELAALGVDPAQVDEVLLSHVHDDHLGWTIGEDGLPLFPRARYVVNRADLDAIRRGEPEDRAIYAATLARLEEAGLLETSDERMRIGPNLELVRAPGHTPGHQVLAIDDGDARAFLSADATNHPALVEEPSWSGTSDSDPDQAATARAELLDLAERDARIWITAHFAEPFVRIVNRDGRRRAIPL